MLPWAAAGQTTPRRDEILAIAATLFAVRGIRTSLQEVADACRIQPGSLYHHFESKEALVVELLGRFLADLDGVAAAGRSGSGEEALRTLCVEVAQVARRHSAAVQCSFYDPPVGSGAELARLATLCRAPSSVAEALAGLLSGLAAAGRLRPGLDPVLLGRRVSRAMLLPGTGLFENHPADRAGGVLADILLQGLAARPVGGADSAALEAVRAVAPTIGTPPSAPGSRSARVDDAARSAFARFGYDVTTMREVAAAAEMSLGAVYRVAGSKEELLTRVTAAFRERMTAGWNAALDADATAVEKLEALAFLKAELLQDFEAEFAIQFAWLRHSPPGTAQTGWSLDRAVRRLQRTLDEGVRAGELAGFGADADLLARCVLALVWMPEPRAPGDGSPALGHAPAVADRSAADGRGSAADHAPAAPLAGLLRRN